MFTLHLYFKTTLTLLCTATLLVGCQSDDDKGVKPRALTQQFNEEFAAFNRENKNLRQWDAPVVSDLDQDGYPDLILNDHGFSIRVMWNNKGEYSKPFDLLMGDAHGISVGDFDNDGLNEIIIARGGGSGSNARNSKIFKVDKNRQFTALTNFDIPLENMRGRTVKFVDLNNNGQLDLLNFAFADKEKKGKSENYVYKNEGNGQLTLVGNLPAAKADGQKTLITDFNNDSIADVVLYGHGAVKVYQGIGDFSFTDVSKEVLPFELKDVTSVAEIDFDNDGDFDLFFTRGKEFNAGDTFYDKNTQIWGFFAKRGDYIFDELVMGDIFELENFQSQWPHKNIFIGESAYKYAYPGETHSGRDVRLVNSDALGFPDTLDNKGAYVGYVGNQRWRVAASIFSPMTGVVRGVQSYPTQSHEAGLQDVLLQNNKGQFIDVTKQQNLLVKEHSMASTVGDFNNDGYADILIVPRGNLVSPIQSLLFLNKGLAGDNQFELNIDHNIVTPELGAIGMSSQAVDYNLDGKLDVVTGNDRGKWHLFNNGFANDKYNHITVQVLNHSDVSALGALVSIDACGSKQIQRLGATSATYSLSFNPLVHFGLGKCTTVDNISVTWSNQVTKTINSTADKISLNSIIKVGA